MDGFDQLSASDKAEASELQRMIAIEQQKAQFQAQVHTFTDVCWDKCVDSPGSKLDYRTETCLQSCVERFIDTTLTITNRFTQMVHTFTDVCWDKCVDSAGSKLDYRTETCLQSCVERFIDTTLTITNRFTQMVQKGAH